MNCSRLLVVACAALLTAGCATGGPNEEAGMMIGGVLGGLLGAQADDGARTVAIIAGTMAGSAIGGAIGRNMDDVDRLRAGQSLETIRTGVSSTWRNPDTGTHYRFTPTRTFATRERPCREYTMEATIGGEMSQVYGTACRQRDGSWQVQN